jgi:hypothetical protein
MRRSLSKEANPTTGESSSFLVGRRIGLWLCWCDEAGEAEEEDSESEEDESSYSVGTTNPACWRSLESQSSNSEVTISGVGPNGASRLLLLVLPSLPLVLILLPKSSKLCRERRPAVFLSWWDRAKSSELVVKLAIAPMGDAENWWLFIWLCDILTIREVDKERWVQIKIFKGKKVGVLGWLLGGSVSIKGCFWLSESGVVVCCCTSSSSGAREDHFCFG